MRKMAALKAVLAFLSIVAIWVGVKFIMCMITHTAFTLMVFSPWITASIILAGLINAHYVYKKNTAVPTENPGFDQ